MSYLARLKQLESVKKPHHTPSTELPKPTKEAFGSFGSAPSPRIEKKHADVEIMPAWDAADWQAYFDERAGVAEYDGGLSRPDAESMAYRSCLAEWMRQNLQTSEPGQCAWCQRGDMPGRAVMPYGDAIHGHTHLHGECWPAWYAQRRQAATVALAGFGIKE